MKNVRIKRVDTYVYNAQRQMWLPMYVRRIQRRKWLFFWVTETEITEQDIYKADTRAEEIKRLLTT